MMTLLLLSIPYFTIKQRAPEHEISCPLDRSRVAFMVPSYTLRAHCQRVQTQVAVAKVAFSLARETFYLSLICKHQYIIDVDFKSQGTM